ncbi:protein JOKA2 [Nicotiana tabacum]|uniref:Protein NBR1 homolog n=1 Tax=Nicotiana tabacum TaxID=4097 RepID=A0A1S3Z0L9_TOBAC|nr:PREDICTED: protein NBR1 homolog [Nicotiana tabacum]XP_016458025.1 PREDICTED: protein NBR1 homolog [Nicotiana tabacum]
MAMESAIVIKVKYEETLRRFNARVINEKLDLNMDGLSDKIFQLFNIARDAELILTYVDEDGDVVTLVDDEDLQDVMRQDLNPLRISVRLNAAERSSRPSSRSSGSSTPLRSPRVQPPFPNLNSSVSDALKSVPEPLRETVMKLYSDLTSRASSSAPILAEVVDGISKMGLSYYQNQPSGSQPVKETNFPSGASNENTMVADGGNSNGKTGVPSINKNEPHTALNDAGKMAKAIESEFKYVDDALDAWVKLRSKSKALEADRTETAPSSSKGPKAPTLLVNSGEEKDKKFGACPGGKPLAFSYISASPAPPEKPSGEKPSKNRSVAKPVDVGGSSSFGKLKQCTWDSRNADSSGSSIKMPTLHLVPVPANECPFPQVPKNASRLVQVPANECPFSGVPNDPVPPPLEVPHKRSHNHSDGTGTIFHRGVRCDGCGVHPITGPRFISKVQENYDLCSICFAEMGNDADYIRMDRPLTYRHPLSFKGLHDLHAARFRIPTVPQVSRGYGVKPGRPKLDSRFIQDVNILDGTIMAPLTRFTKIWRMRNNGNLVWPQGTQLVWIGGDRLSDRFSVELEITTAGLAVDKELDVAVDFTAPEHPGRYISYWRMASSSGQKFGQRVWVLIQVDASSNLPKKELVHEAFHGLNLNLPPAGDDTSGSDIINVNPGPRNVLPEPKSSSTTIELVDSVADVNQNKEQEAIFPTNDSLLVGFGDKSSSSAPGSSISYPIIDLSEEAPAVTCVVPPAAVDTQATPQGVRGKNEIEVSLLRELEEMGFKQVDLNKEILRKNEYDLEQSVDDLCGVAEWDPILEELEEMGFSDKEMNKKLLKKNNGSIKRVVMDLIAGEQ